MRSYQIALFLLAVLSGLAALCWLWPAGGIGAGPVQMQLPSLSQVLSPEKDSLILREEEQSAFADDKATETVEQLVEQRLEMLRQEQEQQFEEFRDSSDTRFYMSDSSYLDPFFAALDDARHSRVRVMHYGDSQIEEDRISSTLRQNFQQTYGGHGVGIANGGLTRYTFTYHRSTVPDSLPRYLGYWPSARSKEKRYGPICQMNKINGKASITIECSRNEDFQASRTYTRVTLFMRGGEAQFQADDTTYTMCFDEDSIAPSPQMRSIDLQRGVNRLKVHLQGPAELYALSLEDTVGVTLDNIAMRGSDGSQLISVAQETMLPFFEAEPIRLILLQFGGNAMGYLATERKQTEYMNTVRRIIQTFRRLAPTARILWIGPSDMSTRIEGQMRTYPWLPKVDELLRETLLDEGCAYWSMYRAMGGYNSMVHWVHSSPQLAGDDYVHFTRKGARHISNILYETFELYYRNYRHRHHLDDESLLSAELDASLSAAPDTCIFSEPGDSHLTVPGDSHLTAPDTCPLAVPDTLP